MNWPADPKTGEADQGKALGGPSPVGVVWENWQEAGDIFMEGGKVPAAWRGSNQANAGHSRFTALPVEQRVRRAIEAGCTEKFAEPSVGAEVRFNEAAYCYIRTNKLNSLQGQIDAYFNNKKISFPAESKVVKAAWTEIDKCQRRSYYAVSEGDKLYGLVGLNVMAKHQSTWFWATFEHVDNKSAIGNNVGWKLSSRDNFACKSDQPDCEGTPVGIGLQGTVWDNYRLRGTQIRYVDQKSVPVLLANSKLEDRFQETSSCMTCHARAAILVERGVARRLPFFKNAPGSLCNAPMNGQEPQQAEGYVGVPLPEWFAGSQGQKGYMQQDFLWSFCRAK